MPEALLDDLGVHVRRQKQRCVRMTKIMESDDGYPRRWIASALADLKTFPNEVQIELGHAPYRVQIGETPERAKPLHGPLRDVLEIVEHDPSGTYRLIYTVKIAEVVYVLHAFQKKSHRGSATPKAELNLIAQRLQRARNDAAARR